MTKKFTNPIRCADFCTVFGVINSRRRGNRRSGPSKLVPQRLRLMLTIQTRFSSAGKTGQATVFTTMVTMVTRIKGAGREEEWAMLSKFTSTAAASTTGMLHACSERVRMVSWNGTDFRR